MRSYLFLFSMSLLIALVLTPVVRRWALRWGAVDWPDDQRRIHQHPTPRLGGAAIYLAFVTTLLSVPLLGNLVSRGLSESWSTVAALMASGTLIFLLGIYDDFRGSKALTKISVQVLAAVILYASGFGIKFISTPFGGSWELPILLSFPLTALWVVSITNAFNLIDGIDGLGAGASAFALLSLFVCSLAVGRPEVSLLSIILVGAVIGFLRYNFNPAIIFLGDSGSLFLGFMAAALALVSAQKGPTLIAIAIPLVSFGLPVAEVGLSLGRRFLSGAPLFQSDRRHIHHMLLRRGLTQRQAAILLYAICALFSLFGLMLLNPRRNTTALIFFVIGVGVVLGVRHLRYAEFNALSMKFKQGVARSRRSLAANAHLLDSIMDLRSAQNLDQFFSALSKFCEKSGFDVVSLELLSASTAEQGGSLWQWRRNGNSSDEVFSDARCWSFRIPLSDESDAGLGAITFFCDMTSEDLIADLMQVCGSLRASLSLALKRLPHSDGVLMPSPSTRENQPLLTIN